MLDDPGAFVPENHRRQAAAVALHLVEIGAADSGGCHAHDDVTRAGLREVELDDLQRLADRPEQEPPSFSRKITDPRVGIGDRGVPEGARPRAQTEPLTHSDLFMDAFSPSSRKISDSRVGIGDRADP